MKKTLFTLLLLVSALTLRAQMTDRQAMDLARRQGLSQQQIESLRLSSQEGPAAGASAATVATGPAAADGSRTRSRPQSTSGDEPPTDGLPPDSEPLPDEEQEGESAIFGHNVFSGKQLTFEPSLNIATPDNYTLGPGDEVIIDVWGDTEQTIRQTLSPDGTIVVGGLGPIALNGLTVSAARARLERSLANIYSSVGGSTFVQLSLGRIRSIQVHVMGEVENPGTYTVSSLSSLFHVLYLAGGVNEIGSLRAIGISRGGERMADVDVYSYLLEGRTSVDIALRDGDVVMVPPYRRLVSIEGGVKRPMRYEMRAGETLATLIAFAGGFAGNSYKNAVTVLRRSERLKQVHNVGRGEYASFALDDGDEVTVGETIDRFENRLAVSGAVFRPGLYAVSDSVATVRQLIGQAEGLRGDAFAGRAILTRENPDYSHTAMPVDVGAIMAGAAPDMALRTNDSLHVSSIFDLRENYVVTISGAVRSPGEFPFADNLSIEDMIVKAGGLLEAASTARVDVFRRVREPGSTSEGSVRSETFTFPIKDGLPVESGVTEFALRPFDEVVVRTSPGYESQKNVAVRGEVLFPGSYTLVKKEERLSDLVARAGGSLSKAYIAGASLTRTLNDSERTRVGAKLKLAETSSAGKSSPDSLSMSTLDIAESYSVGIELDKAIERPGSDYDLVLREGDVLTVPEYVGTVSIRGAVTFPNTVAYRKGMSIRDYIEQAGGFAHRARRRTKIIIYMNGTIARSGSLMGARVEPGCEIVIPYKGAAGSKASMAEILSLGLSATSTAAIVANLFNTMKN